MSSEEEATQSCWWARSTEKECGWCSIQHPCHTPTNRWNQTKSNKVPTATTEEQRRYHNQAKPSQAKPSKKNNRMAKGTRYLTLLIVVIFLLSASVFGTEDGHEKYSPTRIRRSLQKDEAGDQNVGGKLGSNRRLHHLQQKQMKEENTDDIQRRRQADVATSASLSMSLSLSMSMDMSTSQPSDGRTDVDDNTSTCPEDFTVLPMMPCGPSYPVGTVCDYNFQYDGCTWEELQCNWVNQVRIDIWQTYEWLQSKFLALIYWHSPNIFFLIHSCSGYNKCECISDSGLVLGGGSNSDSETARPLPPLWFCISFARLRCPEDTTPVDLPRGPCDPDQPIPVPPWSDISLVQSTFPPSQKTEHKK